MSENTCLLSFVIPCYNAERFLSQCLDSVIKCGLKESQFEVICIDDCSNDSTATILEQYAESHDMIKVIRNESNIGPGGGRNKGIREAQGEYLWFVDADDVIVSDGLVDALNYSEQAQLDVLCFNYCQIDERGCAFSWPRVFGQTDVKDGNEFVKEVFGSSIVDHMGYLWRFLFRTAFLKHEHILSPEHIIYGEDTVFIPRSLLKAKKVASVPNVFYAYRTNPNSTTGSFSRNYQSKMIFELDILTGADLLKFSEDVEDIELRDAFKKKAIDHYINGFVVHLLRTNHAQRTSFYHIIKKSKRVISPLKGYLKILPRLLLVPGIGLACADFMSVVYKIKHGFFSRRIHNANAHTFDSI